MAPPVRQVAHFVVPTALSGSYRCHPRFPDEKPEAPRGGGTRQGRDEGVKEPASNPGAGSEWTACYPALPSTTPVSSVTGHHPSGDTSGRDLSAAGRSWGISSCRKPLLTASICG